MFPYKINADLSLEIIEERHAAELFALADANRAYLRQWLPWLDSTRSVADTQVYIAKCRRQLAENNGFRTVIRYRGEVAGTVGHHSVDWANKSCFLGYWLSQWLQGRGIMTLCCRAFVDHAFNTWGLHRVEIRAAEGNAKSRAVPERLGFTLESTMLAAESLYGTPVNHVVYGLRSSV